VITSSLSDRISARSAAFWKIVVNRKVSECYYELSIQTANRQAMIASTAAERIQNFEHSFVAGVLGQQTSNQSINFGFLGVACHHRVAGHASLEHERARPRSL
jgi:hypothetical protein